MNNFPPTVDELVDAFENPLQNLDVWGRLGSPNAVTRLHEALDAIGAAEDQKNLDTARLVLGRAPDFKVGKIAERHGVKSAAISQRKSRIEQVLDDLSNDEKMNEHPLVRIWRDRAAHCVRAKDLPPWMQVCLNDQEDSAQWPNSLDVFWILLHAAMGVPRLVIINPGEQSEERWLIDKTLDEHGGAETRLDSILESVADRLSKTGSTVYEEREFKNKLIEIGVSTLSVDAVSVAMAQVARRSFTHAGRVLVLNREDAKNLQRVSLCVMEKLGIKEAQIADFIKDQHNRNARSVDNELRKR